MSTEQNRKDYPEVAKMVDEFRSENIPVRVLNLYTIKEVPKGWSIFRQDKSVVNDIVFATSKDANAYLDRLVAHGYCKK
jgi:hypothetical protein